MIRLIGWNVDYYRRDIFICISTYLIYRQRHASFFRRRHAAAARRISAEYVVDCALADN